jgi:hypothetical protein
MTIVQRTVAPANIVSGAKRTSASQVIGDRVRAIRITMTTESPSSWDDVAGQGTVNRWGVEVREGSAGAFTEWFWAENIAFGEHGRSGSMPQQTLDNAQAIKEWTGAEARLFIVTTGVTVRLGCVIEASNVPGELSS